MHLLVDTRSDAELKCQVTIVIGSLAHGILRFLGSNSQGDGKNCLSISSIGLVPVLVESLASRHVPLVEASARTLRILFQNAFVVKAYQCEQRHIEIMTSIVDYDRIISIYGNINAAHVGLRVAETAMSVIAKALLNLDYNSNYQLYQEIVLLLLRYTEPLFDYNPKLQESALDALSMLCRENTKLSEFLVASTSMVCVIWSLLQPLLVLQLTCS